MTGFDGRLVVIGVGHRDRGDDGIGPAVVEALRSRSDRIVTIVREGDLAVLPLLWEPEDDVVIVDAAYCSGEVGRVNTIEPDQLVSTTGLSTHAVSVADAIELSRRLGRSPARLRVIGIGAREFGVGPMSDELRCRIDELAGEVMTLLHLDESVPASDPA